MYRCLHCQKKVFWNFKDKIKCVICLTEYYISDQYVNVIVPELNETRIIVRKEFDQIIERKRPKKKGILCSKK